MRKRRAGLLIGFVAVTLFALFLFWETFNGDGSESGNVYETYSRHYAMITGREDSDLWDRVYESALEEGKERGVYVERFGENLAVEYDRNKLIELAVQASVDGIIVPGDEDEDTVALLDKAVEKGIPVVTVLRDSTGSLRQCFVGNNSYNLGQEYGKQILELLTDGDDETVYQAELKEDEITLRRGVSGKVLVLIDESRMDTSQNLILLGIRETLERALGENHMVSVDTKMVDNTRSFSSEESIRDIFLSSEELPDILVCLSEVHTRCACQAAVDYNKVGNVQMLGYYDSDTILDAVAKNIIHSTITLDTDQMGRLCVQALDEYADTGYTNGYMPVDIHLITVREAKQLVNKE